METKATQEVRSMFGVICAFQDDLITDQVLEYGNHTRPEFAFATSVLDFDMRVFDIGAHIGTFSMLALRKIRDPRNLLSIEGNQETFSLLVSNLKRQGVEDANAVNAFVGARPGLQLETTERNTGASRLVPASEKRQDFQSVSIDQLASRYFVPDYLKIDVEGMEHLVLSESKMVREEQPILYLEAATKHLAIHGHTLEDLNIMLVGLGYKFFVNVGERNARHDLFKVKSIDSLLRHGNFFDVLCVPAHSESCRSLDLVV